MSVKPDRIGHGTFLPPSVGGTQEIVDMIAQQKIPIGVCCSKLVWSELKLQ